MNGSAIKSATAAGLDDQPVLRRGDGHVNMARTAFAQAALRLVSPFLLIGAWEICAHAGLLDVRFFPAPSAIFISAIEIARTGVLSEALFASLSRLVVGYLAGALVGILVGLWIGLSKWSRALVEPWLQLTYPIPKLAIYPLIVMVVGLGDAPIVVLLAIAVFYIVAINTLAGVLSIRRSILDVAKDYGATFGQRVRTIALPGSLPHIFTGLEVSLGIAYIVLVAAEFVGAKTGLGTLIWSSWQLFDVAPMYVAIAVISVLGYASTLGVRHISHVIMPWHKTK